MSQESFAVPLLRFRSAISLPLALFVFGVLGSVLIMVILQGAWWVAVFVGMVLAFIVHAFATTYYVIAPTKLTVRCGFLYNVVIPIDQIISVRSSRDLTSAPALSLRRLSVRHKRGEVLISPVHPHLFIQALLDRGAIIGD